MYNLKNNVEKYYQLYTDVMEEVTAIYRLPGKKSVYCFAYEA